MFLQLATLLFAVQWIGSPWQFDGWKTAAVCLFFLCMVVLSVLPAMFREWGNIKKRLLFYAIMQILCLVLSVLLPGIGQVLTFIFNIILICLPVSFYKFAGTGFFIFFFWLFGLNRILGNSILTDPRGVLSGDIYFTVTDWVIAGIFITAFIRNIYHVIISYPVFKKYNSYDISYLSNIANSSDGASLKKNLINDAEQEAENFKTSITYEVKENINNNLEDAAKTIIGNAVAPSGSGNNNSGKKMNGIKNTITETTDSAYNNIVDPAIRSTQDQIKQAIDSRVGGVKNLFLSNTQFSNDQLKEKEKKTLRPVFIISVIAIIISLFIQPSWKQQSIDDLNAGFSAIAKEDYAAARTIAEKYYNEEKILYNGDVFYLNGLVAETDSPTIALQHYKNAADWYKNHKSAVSQNNRKDSLYRLSTMYMNDTPPDYYRARNAIEQAVKLDSSNKDYLNLQAVIKERLKGHEKEEKIGFFKRIWNSSRSRF